MDFDYSPRTKELQSAARCASWTSTSTRPSSATTDEIEANTAGRQALDAAADRSRSSSPRRAPQGLWNLFLPATARQARATKAPACPTATTRRWPRSWAACRGRSEVFNCSAPDTGNMETLERYGTAEQQGSAGSSRCSTARSARAFAMTEPAVASSRRHQHRSAHRARRRRVRHQRPQVVDLRRRRPALQDLHLHGQDRPRRAAPLAAVDDPGAGATRPASRSCARSTVFGYDDAPHGHMEVDVRERARAGRQHPARRRPRLRDRAGPPRAGPHPPLHAPDRPGRARARADVQARRVARRLRQAARRAGA